jgi:hypothetical protein
VLCLLEAESITPNFDESILNSFDLIITWRESILDKYPHATKMVYGTTWIEQKDLTFNKSNKISFLTSNKLMTHGHVFRQKCFNILAGIAKLREFDVNCIVSPPRIESKVQILDEYKFSVAIENESKKNYFTEKIIDCFATKTVPIYWGCENIGDYFDVNGIIQIDSLESFVEKMNLITPEMYEKMKDAIEYNYVESQKYYGYWDRIEQKIREYL